MSGDSGSAQTSRERRAKENRETFCSKIMDRQNSRDHMFNSCTQRLWPDGMGTLSSRSVSEDLTLQQHIPAEEGGGSGSATAAVQLGNVSPGSTTKAQFQLKQTGILILPKPKPKIRWNYKTSWVIAWKQNYGMKNTAACLQSQQWLIVCCKNGHYTSIEIRFKTFIGSTNKCHKSFTL